MLKTLVSNSAGTMEMKISPETKRLKKIASPVHIDNKRIKSLAEAVILQAIEDLWNANFKGKSTKFFNGNGFNIYAGIAGMKYIEQLKMLRMLGKYN